MKNFTVFFIAILTGVYCFGQQTRFYSDPQEKFKEAKDLMVLGAATCIKTCVYEST